MRTCRLMALIALVVSGFLTASGAVSAAGGAAEPDRIALDLKKLTSESQKQVLTALKIQGILTEKDGVYYLDLVKARALGQETVVAALSAVSRTVQK